MGGIGKMASSILGGGSSGGTNFSATGPSKKERKTTYKNTQEALSNQRAFIQALQAQNAVANQADVFQQQQSLANQLQGMTQGEGPNPALAALNQATGQNVANQAALMAGQRGAGANVGMIARLAAQQGANTQQQSVGQAATLQAQQQLAAIGALQQQQQQMSALSTGQVGQLQQAQGQFGQTALGQQGNIYGLQQSANSANAAIAQQNAKSQGNLLGNIMGGVGSAIAGPIGGMIGSALAPKPQSSQPFVDVAPSMDPNILFAAKGGKVPESKYGVMCAQGGKVPALVSPGEVYIKPEQVALVAKGKNPIKVGEKIPGKAKVSGAVNSYENDIVPKTLEEGGIVIPRSITQSKDAEKKSIAFVKAILKRGL